MGQGSAWTSGGTGYLPRALTASGSMTFEAPSRKRFRSWSSLATAFAFLMKTVRIESGLQLIAYGLPSLPIGDRTDGRKPDGRWGRRRFLPRLSF